jgi:hypothetical protein
MKARNRCMAALCCAVALCAAQGATAAVPGRVNFQGLLLDDEGAPLTGVVDFGFALFPVPSGGSSVWSESHSGVEVTDGIYDVELGTTTPISAALLEGGTLYLEIDVDGETLAPRRQLLAVPYSIRAETAERAEGVGSVPASFVIQLFQHGDSDANGLANSDALEGLGDADGDGVANFVDPDNDDDGLLDSDEFPDSDPNLVTPRITGFANPPVSTCNLESFTVFVLGTSFDEPGLSAQFGSQSPAPYNVTATSFDIDVVVPGGGVSSVPVTVSLGNGESHTATFELAEGCRLAFVTSTTSDGHLGGVAGANQKCAARAVAAGLSGTFLAWLDDSTSQPPVSRFTQAGAAWTNTLGVTVAATWEDLVDGSLLAPIDRNEFGQLASGSNNVWTAVEDNGMGNVYFATCGSAWSSGSAANNGRVGSSNATTSTWTDSTDVACDQQLRLYCFEQ